MAAPLAAAVAGQLTPQRHAAVQRYRRTDNRVRSRPSPHLRAAEHEHLRVVTGLLVEVYPMVSPRRGARCESVPNGAV
eukprot:8155510-Pyramimonas_sp.AAC.1